MTGITLKQATRLAHEAFMKLNEILGKQDEEILHHEDCVSHQDDDYCDCDYWTRLEGDDEVIPGD